jgi:hypothetical protein
VSDPSIGHVSGTTGPRIKGANPNRISRSGLSCPDRFNLDQRPWSVFPGRRRTAVNCNPTPCAFGAGLEDAEPIASPDPWSGTAWPLRHSSPDALPMSAVSAREPDGAPAIG